MGGEFVAPKLFFTIDTCETFTTPAVELVMFLNVFLAERLSARVAAEDNHLESVDSGIILLQWVLPRVQQSRASAGLFEHSKKKSRDTPSNIVSPDVLE